MRAVYRFELPTPGEVKIEIPAGAQILHVALGKRLPCIFALVDTEAPSVVRRFRVVHTGDEIPDADSLHHVGSFLVGPERISFHVFEDRRGDA